MAQKEQSPHATEPPATDQWTNLAVRGNLVAAPILIVFTLPVIVLSMIAMQPAPRVNPWAAAAERVGVEPIQLALGESTFIRTCGLCHGKDGRGVPRLGKPLRNSAFVQSHTDDELLAVIISGRLPTDEENTTGAAMPARAGNPSLDDAQVRNVVHYLRTVQEPGAPTASLDQWNTRTTADAGGAPGDGPSGVGHDSFLSSCSACHGEAGKGIEGLGKPLADTPFIEGKTDEELLAFIKSGRPIWDAENTTGVDMPPKGGNPALSDDEIKTIIEYLRALHDQAGGS